MAKSKTVHEIELKVSDEAVFEAAQKVIRELLENGTLDGKPVSGDLAALVARLRGDDAS